MAEGLHFGVGGTFFTAERTFERRQNGESIVSDPTCHVKIRGRDESQTLSR
jgi:hypothetical protein